MIGTIIAVFLMGALLIVGLAYNHTKTTFSRYCDETDRYLAVVKADVARLRDEQSDLSRKTRTAQNQLDTFLLLFGFRPQVPDAVLTELAELCAADRALAIESALHHSRGLNAHKLENSRNTIRDQIRRILNEYAASNTPEPVEGE